MATAKGATQTKSLLEELDALVDGSINAMSPAELKKFRRDRKKIMQSVTRRDSEIFTIEQSA